MAGHATTVYSRSSASTNIKSSLICTGLASIFEHLISQSSGLSRCGRLCGKRSNATPAPIFNPASCIPCTPYIYFWIQQPSSWLYRIHGHPYFLVSCITTTITTHASFLSTPVTTWLCWQQQKIGIIGLDSCKK